MATRYPPPTQSFLPTPRPPAFEMAPGDMLQRMVTYNERSTSSPFLDPVELSHGAPAATTASLSPSASQTLKRSHWKSVAKAERCFDVNCNTKLSSIFARKCRNCCMCGEVFCHKCTSYRRKLSPDATPDPSLGTLCHVCSTCFHVEVDDIGNSLSWMGWIDHFRKKKQSSFRKMEENSLAMPIPALDTPASAKMRRERVLQEMDRLTNGFAANASWMKSLVAGVPSWQKSSHWVESSKSHQCLNCHNTFKTSIKRLISKKVNCRICGQVYCSQCTKAEIIIFLTSSRSTAAKWAINGKTGTPTTPPYSCVLLPVCVTCVQELEDILIDEIEAEEDIVIEEEDFMDSLSHLQACLYRHKSRIEIWLPQYQKLVDSLEVGGDKSSTQGNKDLIDSLARSQSNLSDQFSQLAIESQKLRKMEPLTPAQAKVLKYITIATFQFYSENMYLFRCARFRLSELMPIESIELIQRALNQISIERVHIFIRQITFEAMNLEIGYKLLGCTITEPLVHCVETLEDEAKVYFEKVGEDWGKHAQAAQRMVQEDFQGTNLEKKKRRRLKIPENVKKTPFRNVIIQYKILSQCSHYMSESLRELNAKTPESCFLETKGAIEEVHAQFDKELAMLLRHHPKIFERE